MDRLLCVVLLAWWAAASCMANDNQAYCNITPKHVLCGYDGVGPMCGEDALPAREVTGAEAELIVNTHNQLRSKVAMGDETRGNPGPQPGAGNMMLMEWDEELARLAQAHADQCVFQHECRDCRRVPRYYVGQNLYTSYRSNFKTNTDWAGVISAWYEEVIHFSFKNIKPFTFDSKTGHYTQVVWHNSNKIGCGFTMFQKDGWWQKLYTCNYGPSGNYINGAMYEEGAGCSLCPPGATCSIEYPGLCESVEPSSSNSGDGTSLTLPDKDSQRDNLIPNPPSDSRDGFNGFNGFNGFVDLNNINPRDVDLDALIRFFNSRRVPSTTNTRTPLPVRLNTVLNRGFTRPSLITAAFTTTSTSQSRLPPTTVESIAAVSTTPSSTNTSSPHESTASGSNLTTNLVQVRDGPLNPPTPEQEDTGAEEEEEEDDAVIIPLTGDEPETRDLMPFLRRTGFNTQVITTSSLDNVQDIINALPPGRKPIVIFRSSTGKLTELNPETLVPLQKSVSHTTTRGPDAGRPPLLRCDLELVPCEVVPVGGNWSMAESTIEGRYMEGTLLEGEGAHVVVKQLLNAPENETVCATLSHRLDAATLPPLQVGVMPLREEMSRWPVLANPGVWEESRVTLQGISSKFRLFVTVGPASGPATVGLGVMTVTEGTCCTDGQC